MMYFSKGTPLPTDVAALQSGPTSILVSWGPSSGATGYRIHYNSSRGAHQSATVSSVSNDHTLSNLQNGDNYTISFVAISQHLLPSVTPPLTVNLGKPTLFSIAVAWKHSSP